MTKKYLPVFLNPLKLLEWEPGVGTPEAPENPTLERLLVFLCPLNIPADLAAIRNRYVEASDKDLGVHFYIGEPAIIENLFGPLRQAKTNYVLGNFIGSIALCGIVAEKVAILIYAINTPDEAKCEKFEKQMFQGRRVNKLKEKGFIERQSKVDFDCISAARKSSLHHWNSPEEDTAEPALQAYAAAVRLVCATTDFKFGDGKVSLNPGLEKYLEHRGVFAREMDFNLGDGKVGMNPELAKYMEHGGVFKREKGRE